MNKENSHLSEPFFSVGVTTYDRVEMLIETLKSILGQTFHDYEVIVSNDNPNRTLTGESLGIDDPRVIFINQPKNLGEFYNMNYLLKTSRGKYFTWMADDDLYHPDFFLSAHRMLTKYDFPPCVFTSFGVVDEKGVIKAQDSVNADEMLMRGADFLRQYLSGKIKALGVMGLFEREYLNSIGGLEDVSNDGRGLGCETMILMRAGLLDRVAYINAPLIFYRVHKGCWSTNNIEAERVKRSEEGMILKTIEVLSHPTLRASFHSNLYSILNVSLDSYIWILQRSSGLTIKALLSHLCGAWKYLSPLSGSPLYFPAITALIKTEARLILKVTWYGIKYVSKLYIIK